MREQLELETKIHRFTNIPANSDIPYTLEIQNLLQKKISLDPEDFSRLSIAQSRAMSLIDTKNCLIYNYVPTIRQNLN